MLNYSIIEIVIPKGSSVIFHLAHQFKFQFPTIEIEVGGTLKDVSGIKEQGIRIFLSDGIDKGIPSGHSTQVGIVGIVHREGINMGMHVVGVQDGNMLSFLFGRKGHQANAPHGGKGSCCCCLFDKGPSFHLIF